MYSISTIPIPVPPSAAFPGPVARDEARPAKAGGRPRRSARAASPRPPEPERDAPAEGRFLFPFV